MAHFPNTFAESLTSLPADLGESGNAPVTDWHKMGWW